MRTTRVLAPLCAIVIGATGCSGGLKEAFGHNLASTTPPTSPNGAMASASPAAAPTTSGSPAASSAPATSAPTPAIAGAGPTATPFTGALTTPPPATPVPDPTGSAVAASITLPNVNAPVALRFGQTSGGYPVVVAIPALGGGGGLRVAFAPNPFNGLPALAGLRRTANLGGTPGIFFGFLTFTATTTPLTLPQSPQCWVNYVPVNGPLATVQPGRMAVYDPSNSTTGWNGITSGYVFSTIGNVYYPGAGQPLTLQPNAAVGYAAYLPM